MLGKVKRKNCDTFPHDKPENSITAHGIQSFCTLATNPNSNTSVLSKLDEVDLFEDATCGIVDKLPGKGVFIGDECIRAAQFIMKHHKNSANFHILSYTAGLMNIWLNESKVDETVLSEIPKDKPTINIHFSTNHWLTSIYYPLTKTAVVYDSFASHGAYHSIDRQLQLLYNVSNVEYHPTTQQESNDCGAFAVAYAFSLLLSVDPLSITYDAQKVRDHFRVVLQKRKVVHFPIVDCESHCKEFVYSLLEPDKVNSCKQLSNINSLQIAQTAADLQTLHGKETKLASGCCKDTSHLNGKQLHSEKNLKNSQKTVAVRKSINRNMLTLSNHSKASNCTNHNGKIEPELRKKRNLQENEKTEIGTLHTNEQIPNSANDDETDEPDSAGVSESLFTGVDYLEDTERHKIYSMAPGEGTRPISIFTDRYSEELSFPQIFLGNARTHNKKRITKMYYSDICKSELRRADRRVARNIKNIFFKVKKLTQIRLMSSPQVALRKHQTRGKTYKAGQLKKSEDLQNLIRHDEGFTFLKNIRGSPPYFQQAKKDLFAMIRQLGSATYFCSFSCAETKWIHLLKMLGKLVDNTDYTDEEIKQMSWQKKCDLIKSDPVTCARQFDYQIRHFITDFLMDKAGPIGQIQDWFYRIEYQSRCSCHAHFLIWIKDAPQYGTDTTEDVIKFVDSNITCEKPHNNENLEELVSRQVHKHSPSCKTSHRICRFNFPQPPMRSTQILTALPHATEKYAEHRAKWKSIYEDMNKIAADDELTFDEFLKKYDVTEESYILAVRTSIKRDTIFLKRRPNEIRINNYNKYCVLAWQANMDIQFVTDIYACAMYIVSYISKSQRGMSELLAQACKEARLLNLSVKEQFRHVAKTYSHCVEIGAQEAIYNILGMAMRRSSRSIIFIPTNPPNERTVLLKCYEQLQQLQDDDEDIESGNMIKRYACRPFALNNLTLASWAAWYDKAKYNKHVGRPGKQTIEGQDYLDEVETEDYYDDVALQEDLVETGISNVPVRRKHARIIRPVWFNKQKEPEKYFRELIMLFTPWRSENTDLIGNCTSFHARYIRDKDEIDEQLAIYAPNHEQLQAALEEIANTEIDDNLLHHLAPNTQQANLDDIQQGDKTVTEIEDTMYDISKSPHTGLFTDEQIVNKQISDAQHRENIRKFSKEQREIFDHLLHKLKTGEQGQCHFLSGGAGCGKTFFVNTFTQAVLKHYASFPGQAFNAKQILLLAPTGKAAYNIKGNTIHSALAVGGWYGRRYVPLTNDKLTQLRAKYNHVKYIFIDEISMVGNELFNSINGRLKELRGNYNSPFGGINILVIGDLFQLKPIGEKWVFEQITKDYAALDPNIWEEKFTMFELTTIMRQKDDKQFAELLNRLRENNHTTNDIAQLKKRTVSVAEDLDSNYNIPHIYYLRNNAKLFNNFALNKNPEQKHILRAIDSVLHGDSDDLNREILSKVSNYPANNTAQLETLIRTAVNQKVDICVNVRVDDGLTNGAPATVRHVEYSTTGQRQPKIIWVEFEDSDAGHLTRADNRNICSRSGIDKSWTPIFQIFRNFKATEKHVEIQRKQFPITPAHARTIHKAQGATYQELVCDFTLGKNRPHHLHYVGLSRVCSIDKLHILNLNENAIVVDPRVTLEMERLRTTSKLQIPFNFFYNMPLKTLKILFLNTSSLHKHIEDIRADFNIQAADICIFAETFIKCSENAQLYAIANLPHVFLNSKYLPNNQRPKHGCAIFSRYEFASDYPKNENINTAEITHVKIAGKEHLNIIGIYRPPNSLQSVFFQKLSNILLNVTRNSKIIVIGDFNINWLTTPENHTIKEMLCKNFNLKQHIVQETTANGTLIDHLYTNYPTAQIATGIFETYYTDHKAIWIAIPRQTI